MSPISGHSANALATDFNDEDSNTSANPSIQTIVATRLSRRGLLRAGVGTAGSAVFAGLSLSACGGGSSAPAAEATPGTTPSAAVPADFKLGFTPVDKSLLDQVTVPVGYTASVIYALGDPLDAATPTFLNDGTDTGYASRSGDHHDGMEYFGLDASGTARDANGSERGLLAMNHEAITDQFLHASGTTANPRPTAEADKEMDCHGVSIVEVRKTGGRFAYVQTSAHNRRITPSTPIKISGIARGNALVKTVFSPTGIDGRGTINNCGTGYTPWGTFLTGEENWFGYFTRSGTDNTSRGSSTARSVVSLNRYGRAQGAASRHGWETAGAADKYARWNISQTGISADGSDDYRNEMNTYGYIVEVDPYDSNVAIKKRTTLGRFAHESAVFGKPVEGKPLAVYQGDDSRGEYMYKFVSTAVWSATDSNPASRIGAGDKYLDSGKLYVAKFNADGTGTWVELALSNAAIAGNAAVYAFADQADVLVNARLAADAVGATKMDRPEWCAVHPGTGEIYYTLTNNSNRKINPTGTQQLVDSANPRSFSDSFAGGALGSPGNVNGHIIRIKENGSEPAAVAFTWDVYLFGAQADADAVKINLSGLTASQDFSSPDGLWFSPTSNFCYIQTDDGSFTDVTNCMMLIGKPGQVGDGAPLTLNHTKTDGSNLPVVTRMGVKATNDNLRRFLVGPSDCEITGCAETPDGKALFVNIQHPGEAITKANVTTPSTYLSHWPGNAGFGAGGANARPRSATIVITKNDGGVIGT